MQERSEAERRAIMAMPQCCYLAKGAKRPSHTTNTIKFDRIPFDPSNSIKRFDLCPFDQKNSTCLQPPVKDMSNEIIFSRMSSLAARVDRMKKLSSVEILREEGIWNSPIEEDRVGKETEGMLQCTSIAPLQSFQRKTMSSLIRQ